MQQLLPALLFDRSNGSFSNTILEVGVDSTVGKSLFLSCAVVDECIVGETAIVCMIVIDADVVIGGELLECMFCLDGFVAAEVLHEMDIAEAREVVDEDGCCLVSLFGERSFELSDESRLCGDHLVDRDDLSWSGCLENLLA